MSRPLITIITIISILMASLLLLVIIARRDGINWESQLGHGWDGAGNEFYCSGGPVPEGGLTYATTDPEGRPRCIRPPSPSPVRP